MCRNLCTFIEINYLSAYYTHLLRNLFGLSKGRALQLELNFTDLHLQLPFLRRSKLCLQVQSHRMTIRVS